MKSVIFTYTSRARGQEGEASTNILLEDEQAAAVKAAYDNRKGAAKSRTSSCGARSMTCVPPAKRSGAAGTSTTA